MSVFQVSAVDLKLKHDCVKVPTFGKSQLNIRLLQLQNL